MGTRGTCGVRIDGQDKLSYNHFDSYPDGLGVEILYDLHTMISEWGIEKLRERARALRQVDSNSTPTAEEIKALSGFADLSVSRRTPDEWYCLLRELQGRLMDTLVVGMSIEGNNFINDSLFCEWGYIVNLDENVLEVYTGFQDAPHNKGRYASATDGNESYPGGSTYYPCAFLVSFSLDNLPTEEEFIIGINRAPFESTEDMVLNHLKDYGDLTAEDAASRFGIDNIGEVIEALVEVGNHDIRFDGETYELLSSDD